jgi:transcriptional regulator with GAF, ATPase, and Fis domain
MRHEGTEQLIGTSGVIAELSQEIDRIARSDAKVLITGESGVGKELVAHAIHQRSPRAQRPMVAVNCAGLPETLLESELFGHVKGSFTGAYRDKQGKLEMADRGSIFLDEIGEMTLRMQGLLLRFMETGELQKVGADRIAGRVNVRVIAATNRNLRDMINEGTFREDLFYRLNVIHLVVPPLRERREDIPALIDYFMHRFTRNNGHPVKFISPDANKLLCAYSWPGNVRELANLIERLSILCGPTVDAGAVRGVLRGGPSVPVATGALGLPLSDALDDFERGMISAAMAQAEGNVAEAARVLQTDRANLYRRMRRLGIEKATEGEG